MERLIKGVKEESWKAFRSEAAKHGFKAGEFLGYLVEEHRKTESKGKGWNHILSKKSSLDTDSAARMKKAIRIFEEEYDFE